MQVNRHYTHSRISIYYEKNLAKRNRYYNALTDSKLLFSGDDFGALPELISIWILSYDPFGDNRMSYSVKNFVTENPSLVYNDGVTTIFLNTKNDSKVGERYMSMQTVMYYEKKMSYEEGEEHGIQLGKERGIQLGEERGIQLGEERGIQLGEERLAKKLAELGVDPDIIKQAMTKESN